MESKRWFEVYVDVGLNGEILPLPLRTYCLAYSLEDAGLKIQQLIEKKIKANLESTGLTIALGKITEVDSPPPPGFLDEVKALLQDD